MCNRAPRLIVFGTYNRDYPRIRIIAKAMRRLGLSLEECHMSLWTGTDDRLATAKGRTAFRTALRAAIVYPFLMVKGLLAAPFDAVMVTTGGFLDILFAWPLAKVAGAQVIFDPHYGLHETVVEDRELVLGEVTWFRELFE